MHLCYINSSIKEWHIADCLVRCYKYKNCYDKLTKQPKMIILSSHHALKFPRVTQKYSIMTKLKFFYEYTRKIPQKENVITIVGN